MKNSRKVFIALILAVGVLSLLIIFYNDKFFTTDEPIVGELRGYPHQDNPFLEHDTIYKVVSIKDNYVEYMNVKDSTVKSNTTKHFLSVTDKIDE